MKGMIFAAGLGTRLKPFTLKHPKALVEIGGKPMLEHAIELLARAGITEIYVNVHHFADQVIDYIAHRPDSGMTFHISDETSEILDTGGALARVAPMIGNDSLLVCNADILTDVDLRLLIHAHTDSKSNVTLLVDKRDSTRQLYFNNCMELIGWQNIKTGETRPDGFTPNGSLEAMAFGGIHIVGPRMLDALCRQGESTPVFPVIPFYLANLDRFRITGYRQAERYLWHDVGSPEKLAAARADFSARNFD